VEVGILAKLSDNFSPTVPSFADRISRVVGDVQTLGGESGNVSRRGKAMANYPKNLPRTQCARAIPVP